MINNEDILKYDFSEAVSQKARQIKMKIEALKEYAKKYNTNFGFVRDYDKNESLYLCNTEYTEGMENENWKLLKCIFRN